eukprot:763329-Hanusia_phi.AAC.1
MERKEGDATMRNKGSRGERDARSLDLIQGVYDSEGDVFGGDGSVGQSLGECLLQLALAR